MRKNHLLALVTLVATVALIAIALESVHSDHGAGAKRSAGEPEDGHAEDGLAEATAPLSEVGGAEISENGAQGRSVASDPAPEGPGRSRLDPIGERLADARERYRLAAEQLNDLTSPIYNQKFETGDFTVLAEGESPDASSGKLISVRQELDGTVKVAEIPRAGHAREYTLKEEADSLRREMLLLELEHNAR